MTRRFLHNGPWSSLDDAWSGRKPDSVDSLTPSFCGTTTHHSSKPLAKRALHSAVASERPAGRGGRYPIYGNDALDLYRRAGAYTGRILKGDRPGELPIDQATKFELV